MLDIFIMNIFDFDFGDFFCEIVGGGWEVLRQFLNENFYDFFGEIL